KLNHQMHSRQASMLGSQPLTEYRLQLTRSLSAVADLVLLPHVDLSCRPARNGLGFEKRIIAKSVAAPGRHDDLPFDGSFCRADPTQLPTVGHSKGKNTAKTGRTKLS